MHIAEDQVRRFVCNDGIPDKPGFETRTVGCSSTDKTSRRRLRSLSERFVTEFKPISIRLIDTRSWDFELITVVSLQAKLQHWSVDFFEDIKTDLESEVGRSNAQDV